MNGGDASVVAAAASIRAGGIVGYPTETLYGLGVSIDRAESLERLFSMKRRPRTMPVSVAVASAADISQVGRMSKAAAALVGLLPGPLTLILEPNGRMHQLVGGPDGVAVRVPDHDVARALIGLTGPITCTSANVHGQPPAIDRALAAQAFGDRVDYYLRGTSAASGVASTVVDCRAAEPKILREGDIAESEILRRTANR